MDRARELEILKKIDKEKDTLKRLMHQVDQCKERIKEYERMRSKASQPPEPTRDTKKKKESFKQLMKLGSKIPEDELRLIKNEKIEKKEVKVKASDNQAQNQMMMSAILKSEPLPPKPKPIVKPPPPKPVSRPKPAQKKPVPRDLIMVNKVKRDIPMIEDLQDEIRERKQKINVDKALKNPKYVEENYSSIIQQMMGRKRPMRYDSEDDSSDMEVGYSQLNKEEKRR
ncbi:hypothetical protein EDD86DRAFT_72102 [Gorgonomyces haynaldii]|nr:hypothetical protein EDD86DRAFT_72102 [Gorgonomyces haynaldii]